eukprot:6179910-Pleurochrysis_carterae.AAC.4
MDQVYPGYSKMNTSDQVPCRQPFETCIINGTRLVSKNKTLTHSNFDCSLLAIFSVTQRQRRIEEWQRRRAKKRLQIENASIP